MATYSIDTIRLCKESSAVVITIDTLRKRTGPATFSVDTSRKRKDILTHAKQMTVTLNSKTLMDAYSLESSSAVNNGTIFGGLIYGHPWECSVNGKSYDPKTQKYIHDCNLAIADLVKKYVTFSTAPTDAQTIIEQVAGQLGKTPVVLIDTHGVRRFSQQTTVMQAIDPLFGWTAEIPHQMVNVFLRDDKLYCIQRGKETGNYTPVNYNILKPSDSRVDTLMDESLWQPQIIGDPDGSYTDGEFQFGPFLIIFDEGYVIQQTANGETTTFVYSADDPNDPDSDDRYIVSETKGNTTTTYEYEVWKDAPYLSRKTVATGISYGANWFPSYTLMEAVVTEYHPTGSGWFGGVTTKVVQTWEFFYYLGNFYGHITGKTVTNEGSTFEEGRPGGKVSPRERSGEENTPAVNVVRNPIAPAHIPVTDVTTLTRYAAGLVWLDGKTEYRLQFECTDAHIIDFTETVTIMGETWFLESNVITLSGEQPHPKQTVEVVRWA